MLNGLEIHTGNRLETLVEVLAERLGASPLSPLEHELIVVESLGMGRWLTLEIARRSGIAAGIDTPFPRSLVRWLARRVLGGEFLPASEPLPRGDDSPWGRDILTWRIDRLLGEEHPDLETTAAYLAGSTTEPAHAGGDRRKRHALASHLAGLFDAYQLYRPHWLRRWRRGETPARDSLESSAPDPHALPSALHDTAVWQAHLWRRLVEDTDVAPLSESLLHLHDALRSARRGDPAHGVDLEALPRRLSVFGVSTLPPAFLDLLGEIAQHRPVGLYFTSPTAGYWADLRSEREQFRIAERSARDARSETAGAGAAADTATADPLRHDEPPVDEQHWEVGNPLLVALGRQGRDFFDLLQHLDPSGQAWHEHFTTLEASRSLRDGDVPSALETIQHDLLELVDRTPEERLPLDPADRSLRFAVCHGTLREMEVLRDRLLAAFDEMPGLRPSDVLVLVPDVERYGPLVQAVFGVEHADGRALPFSIADRRAGRERPPAESLLQVLALVDARRTVAEIFDLLDVPAVRRGAGLGASDLPALRRRVVRSGVRWGVDGATKARDFELPDDAQNTWRVGIDRLLMGSATGETDRPLLGIVPAAGDLPGDDEELGRFLAFVDTLFEHLEALRAPRPPAEWRSTLLATVDALFEASDDADELGLQLAREAIDGAARAAEAARFDEPVPRQVMLDELETRLGGSGFGSGFVDGRITVCALQPMRAVPFRLVAVCGLDDASFPRRAPERDFDLIARAPRRGDRSPRDDDRFLFLETLLAARERLAISWVGRSQRDGAVLEPSLVVEELLSAVDRTFVHPEGPEQPAREALIEEHPLQPWSAAYYDASAPRSFSLENLDAARAAVAPREPLPAFVHFGDDPREESEIAPDPVEIELHDLLRFWRNPSAAYARTLGLRGLDEPEEEEESEPFALDGLASWQLRDELVRRRLAGSPEGSCSDAASSDGSPSGDETAREEPLYRGRGVLPAGSLGAAALAAERRRADAYVGTVSEALRAAGAPPAGMPTGDDRFAHEVDLPIDLRNGPSLDPTSEPDRDELESGTRRVRLVGRIESVPPAGLFRPRCGTLRPRDRLTAWIEHLALQAAGVPGTAVVLGETEGKRYRAIDSDEAIRSLEPLLRGFVAGHERPLPVFESASPRFETERRKLLAKGASAEDARRAALDKARRAFETPPFQGRGPRPDIDDVDVDRIHRGADPLAGRDFATWSTALWGPLLEAEEDF